MWRSRPLVLRWCASTCGARRPAARSRLQQTTNLTPTSRLYRQNHPQSATERARSEAANQPTYPTKHPASLGPRRRLAGAQKGKIPPAPRSDGLWRSRRPNRRVDRRSAFLASVRVLHAPSHSIKASRFLFSTRAGWRRAARRLHPTDPQPFFFLSPFARPFSKNLLLPFPRFPSRHVPWWEDTDRPTHRRRGAGRTSLSSGFMNRGQRKRRIDPCEFR